MIENWRERQKEVMKIWNEFLRERGEKNNEEFDGGCLVENTTGGGTEDSTSSGTADAPDSEEKSLTW